MSADIKFKCMETSDNFASDDLRRWQRFKVDLRIKVSYQSDGKRLIVFGRGSDVSSGGMSAYIPADLVAGETVELELTLPYSPHPIKINAMVRNRADFRYGLEYGQLSKEYEQLLTRSLSALALVQ